jgi:predicted ATPase/DNA-binding XRE family transcriptional regulator
MSRSSKPVTNTNQSKRQPNDKLRNAREERGWTQNHVAELTGAPDSQMVGRWERGEVFPNPHYRAQLRKVFGMTFAELALDKSSTAKPEPPLAVLRPNKLPIVFSTFIGRKQEVNDVNELLIRPTIRLLTLLGTGGIGKTRLATVAAEQVKEHFVDGVCYVPLASLGDPNMLIATLASALGIQPSAEITPEQQVKNILRDKHMLLFMDNFEHLISASSMIESLLQDCPEITVLVTSRQVLQLQAEHIFEVPVLSKPDRDQLPEPDQLMQYTAVALFMQRAQEYLPTFKLTAANASAIAELCIRLDGLPLAIELAAVRIKLYNPQGLLTRLNQDQHILKNGLRSAPERHYTLDYMIKWSYDLLSEREKWFFQHFAVFISGAQLETIEDCFNAVIQPGTLGEIVEVVDSVLNKTLIQRIEQQENAGPRFVMLETIRQYALDCLRESGNLHTQYRAYALYYLQLVEQAAPLLKSAEQAQWLAKLDLEVDNLRDALRWLITQQETELALRFSEAFGKFCGLRGYWNEERLCLATALQLPVLPGSQQQAIRAKVLRRAGHLAYRLRDLAHARLLLEESASYSREIHDLDNLAGALSTLGWVLYRQNEQEDAGKLLQECVDVAYQSENNWVLANSLESQGRFMHSQGCNDEAHALLEKSISAARRSQDKESLARLLTTQVTIAIAQNNLEQAMELAQESHGLATELGTKPLLALTIDRLGDVALFRGDYLQARQLFKERIAIAEQLGDISTVISRQLKLAEVALALGDFAQETFMVKKALDFLRAQGDKSGTASSLCMLGDLKLAAGENIYAYDCYRTVLQRYKEPGDKRQVGRCLIGLAQIMLEQERYECAITLLGAASAWIHTFDMHPQQRSNFQQTQEKVKHLLSTTNFTAQLIGEKNTSLESILLCLS